MQTRKLSLLLVSLLFLSLFPLVYAAYVFSDGFEVGNGYGGWTGTTNAGTGTIAINQTIIHHGVNSSKSFSTTSADTAYARKTLSSASILYARAYVYFVTIGSVANKDVMLLTLDSGSYADHAVIANLYNKIWQLRVYENFAQSNAAGTHTPVTGQWYCVEILRDVTNDNETLWIDGVKEATLATAITTDTTRITTGIAYTNSADDNAVIDDCVVVDTSRIGLETSGLNLSFNLPEVPVVTATLNKGIEIFKAVSGAPAFTSSITYGLEWLFNLAEIPVQTATLVYGRALAFGLSEIPKIIADLVAEKGKNVIFDLSIIPAIITDLVKNVELKRSLSEIPKIIVDMTKEIELSFVEFVLTEVPVFTATLETLITQTLSTADMALALGIMAFILALAALALAVLMKH